MNRFSMAILILLAFTCVGSCAEELGQGQIPTLSATAERLDSQHIRGMQQAFAANKYHKQMQNAVTKTKITDLALNRDVVVSTNDSFSNKLDDWSVTDQKRSGRCWMFAGLNLLRAGAMKKMNLEDFEFSQNYVFFWDKVERANYFLESIIDTADRSDGDRTVDFLLDESLSDGGQWHMFVSLVKKYGLVPKSAMPETESSSDSWLMNQMLRAKLHEGAKGLRQLHAKGASIEELRRFKHEILTVIYRILSFHLGSAPDSFDWQWRDKDKEFHRDGVVTPQEFAEKYVSLQLDDYVCLVHDPRPANAFGRTYTIAYLGNVVGGVPVSYLNVEIDVIKKAVMRTLVDGEPVWFGCDVGKQMDKELGIWDSRLFDFERLYDTTFSLTKADRLIYHQTKMTHAMLFTGVDVLDEEPRRWRVENSWGDEIGKKGFFAMNSSWFDEYVFEVVVNKKYLSEDLQKVLELEPVVLPPWDPMGSLAREEALLGD